MWRSYVVLTVDNALITDIGIVSRETRCIAGVATRYGDPAAVRCLCQKVSDLGSERKYSTKLSTAISTARVRGLATIHAPVHSGWRILWPARNAENFTKRRVGPSQATGHRPPGTGHRAPRTRATLKYPARTPIWRLGIQGAQGDVNAKIDQGSDGARDIHAGIEPPPTALQSLRAGQSCCC